jgi:hypothetical protein
MAFVLPTFNITCNIYTWPLNIPGGPRISPVCQLRAPAANNGGFGSGLLAVTQIIQLLLPPLTDIRDSFAAPINASDYVEVPAGSGCYYQVMWVNDIGKGFPNEHRYATLAKTTAGGGWPVPMP